MYEPNSDRQWVASELLKSNLFALPMQQQTSDSDEELEQGISKNSSIESVTTGANQLQLELLLSNLLRYGVFLASTVVLIGGILYLLRHGTEPADYKYFLGEPAQFRSPQGVLTSVLSGSRRGIIQLGLLLLIATPIMRVAISLLTFLRQRDFTYVVITLFVLVGLIYSLIGAYY